MCERRWHTHLTNFDSLVDPSKTFLFKNEDDEILGQFYTPFGFGVCDIFGKWNSSANTGKMEGSDGFKNTVQHEKT